MATTITGTVFNDINHNGVRDPGEPGISNVFVTLRRVSNGTCVQTSTNTSGVYSFTVHAAGTYQIFETVAMANACPPTLFTQPPGFTVSNGPRERTVVVQDDDQDNDHQGGSDDKVIDHQDFSHDTIDAPLACTTTLVQFVNTPTEWVDIDVVTGASTNRGLLTPADDVNAIGYNILDDYLYGYDQTTRHIVRVDSDRELMQLAPNPTGLPSNDFNVGSFDLNGHLFLMVNDTARFYTVDLKPNSPTFMKLVDPTNGFTEQTSSFGTPLSTTLNISDWAFSPIDGFLYGVRSVGNTGQVMQVNPLTGTVTALTTTLGVLDPTGRSWGAVAMDATGVLFAIYNGDGGVFRFTISGNTAVGVRISTTFPTSFNDAAMCPIAVVGAIADIGVVKTASPNPVTPGTVLTYTIAVTNGGPDSADHVTLTDTIPTGVLSPQYSVDGNPFQPWPGSLDLGTFDKGDSATVTIRGTVAPSASGSISNTAVVDSDASDPNPENNTSTVSVPVAAASADMAVFKEAAPNPVAPGGTLLYTITVSNLGPSDAQNVLLTDAVPTEVLSPEVSLNGSAFQPWSGSLDLGTMAANTSANIRIRGTVSVEASGTISNTAVVSSDTPDPNHDNNTDTAVVSVSTACDARCQAITDLIESVALQEAALAHILNAEGEKLQKIIRVSDSSPILMLQANQSVQSMTDAVTQLENVLLDKLNLFGDCLCSPF